LILGAQAVMVAGWWIASRRHVRGDRVERQNDRAQAAHGADRAVTLMQHFGSALNCNTHFHLLFLDGEYPGCSA
jgi:hypothetical protein